MIKVENVNVWGFEHAIRGMRNPMNSWDKSDSVKCYLNPECPRICKNNLCGLCIGDNDLTLMKKLYKAGTEHRKYLRQIFVSMDIVAPLYWISEFDTYKIGTVRNSCSFMHKGVSKPFDITDFSIHDKAIYDILLPLPEKEYELVYPYETDDFRYYECQNGRKYRVYRNGRVFSEPYEYTDTLNRTRKFEYRECVPSKTSGGYYELNLGGRNGEKRAVHRLVASVWLDNKVNGGTVNHKNGNKGDNSAENLEWCTLEDNIRHGFGTGLYKNGKSSHAKYLKWKNGHTVVEPFVKTQILDDHKNGLTCKDIASKYNITVSQANNLICSAPNELFLKAYSWETILDVLNELRQSYLDTLETDIFQQIRCLLPCGYNQRFTVTMNYENVVSIIKQRENHKLDEWREFVEMLKNLPYIKEIME